MEGDPLADRVECQVALVAESILKFVDTESVAQDGTPENTPQDSIPAVQKSQLKEVQGTLEGLTKLMSECSVTSGRVIAEILSEMEDFLQLVVTLMKTIQTNLMTFGPVETPLKVLRLCQYCLASWTDKSRLFSKRLLQSCGNLVHQLAVQLKIFHAVWVPTRDLVALSKSVLIILWNLAQEPSCHEALIQNCIPQVVVPFCCDSNVQVRWDTKCFLALLYQLIGPCYYPFLKLSLEEVRLLRLCFETAATSDDHNVILKLGNSVVKYSALELSLGMAGLTQHEANAAALADPDMFAATFKFLGTGSVEEKFVSIQLMSKLVNEPEACAVILGNHPALLEILQSLAENDETTASLKKNASDLLQKLLDGISSIASTRVYRDTPELQTDHSVLEREGELKRVLAWATKEISMSKVLHDTADEESNVVVLSMIFLISQLQEMSHFTGSDLSVKIAMQDSPGFLSILQDYTQRLFYKAIKNESAFHPLHSISLALHCMLILSRVNSHFRCELGMTGIVLQLVNNLRSMQMIPGWNKEYFRVAELMLLVIANCSLECNCQQLLAENSVVETLLPFCKSDYFGIRLGAKSSLSSISTSVAKQHHLRFFQMNKHEHVALFNTLKEFSEAGSYRKRFQTTLCDYYFSALDLLLLLNALMENSFNKELVQSSNISLTLSQFLTTGTKLEKDIVVELLWRLCRSQTMRLHVLSYVPHHIQDELPIEVFNTEKPLQFSCDSTSHLLDANARPDSISKHGEINNGLSDLEDLLFDTMDEIWRSRVPAAIEGGPYLLDPMMIMSMFVHLAKFFETTDRVLHEEACLIIMKLPTFLPLVANVMTKQLEAKSSKLKCEQDVQSIMLVFHCLQIWINCCEQMKDYLGHSGIIATIVTLHLELIQAFPALDKDYVEIAEAVLSTLSQCVTRETCRNYMLNLRCEDLLATMAKSAIFEVSYNAKIILSFLARYLPPQYQSYFKLTPEDLADVLHSLDLVLEHGIAEGELFFSALELLESFKCFLQFETNRETMAYSTIYKPIVKLLQGSDAAEQQAACELLWKLVTRPMSENAIMMSTKTNKTESVEELSPQEYMSEPDIRLFVLQNYPEIFAILLTFSTGSGGKGKLMNILFSCTLLVLGVESEEVIGRDIMKTLTLSEGCYMYGKYTECFKLASWLYHVADNEKVRKKALDLKGKALYYVFTFEKRSLKKNVSKNSFALCYNKANEAINLLGLTIDSGVDKVAERHLDQVHFDYIRYTRSPNLVRCLLCRKKRKLKASHVWPNSVLKHLWKCMSSSKKQAFSVSWKNYGSLQTAKQLTFPMLCENCEKLLNCSCENKFKVEFFSRLYDPEDYDKLGRAQSIQYGDYLYRFCLSIIFRALPLIDSTISQMGNADDIYNLFAICRELLQKRDISSSPNKPSIALLILPTTLPEGVTSVPMIGRILHSAGIIKLGSHSLYDCKACHGKSSFLLASIGVLNLVVSLDPQMPLLLPPTSMIVPKGGIFMFPEDSKRFFTLPIGVWKLLESLALNYAEQVFHLPQKLVKSQDWAKYELSDLQSMLFGFKPDEDKEKALLHYLPDDFHTFNALKFGKPLQLPDGHHVLLHMHEEKDFLEILLFLAIGTDVSADSQFSCSNPYAILILWVPGYEVSIGYFVSHDEPVATTSLVSSEDNSLLPSIEAKFQTRAVIDTLLPRLLQLRGFSSIQVLLFCLERMQNHQLDMKCVEACWYCSGRCDNCMEITSFDRGPLLGHHIGYTVRFCNDECLKHYRFHRGSSNTQVLFHPRPVPLDMVISHRHLLTVFCGLLDTDLERNKVGAHFFLDSDAPEETVYVLLQVRLVPKQRFLAFIMSDDFSPVASLPNFMPLRDEDMFIIAGLQKVMKNLLSKLDLPDFSSFKLDGGKSIPEKSIEMPLLQLSLDCLPHGFKIHEVDQTITYPDPYHIVLHKTEKEYATYLLAAKIEEDYRFLALFYVNTVDCNLKLLYTAQNSLAAIIVKKLESKSLSNSYDELLEECCRNLVRVELTSMLQERSVTSLGTYVTSHKPGSCTAATKCPKTCWLCHPKSPHVQL